MNDFYNESYLVKIQSYVLKKVSNKFEKVRMILEER